MDSYPNWRWEINRMSGNWKSRLTFKYQSLQQNRLRGPLIFTLTSGNLLFHMQCPSRQYIIQITERCGLGMTAQFLIIDSPPHQEVVISVKRIHKLGPCLHGCLQGTMHRKVGSSN